VYKYKYYVCSKQGFKRTPTNVNSNQKLRLTREGCQVMVGFRRSKHGKYELFRFREGYTHVLSTPRKLHMLNSNRGVTYVCRTLFKSLTLLILALLRHIILLRSKWVSFKMFGVVSKIWKFFKATWKYSLRIPMHKYLLRILRERKSCIDLSILIILFCIWVRNWWYIEKCVLGWWFCWIELCTIWWCCLLWYNIWY